MPLEPPLKPLPYRCYWSLRRLSRRSENFLLDGRAQVLPRGACSSLRRRRALLHSAMSGRCVISQSFLALLTTKVPVCSREEVPGGPRQGKSLGEAGKTVRWERVGRVEGVGGPKILRSSKKLKLGLAPTDEMGIILSCAFGKSATDWQIPR